MEKNVPHWRSSVALFQVWRTLSCITHLSIVKLDTVDPQLHHVSALVRSTSELIAYLIGTVDP